MVMSGAQIYDTHRVTILSSAAAGSKVTLTTENDTIIGQIEYKSVAYIIRQLDQSTFGTSHRSSRSTAYLHADSCNNYNANSRQNNNAKTSARIKASAIPHQLKIIIVGLETRQRGICLQRICVLLNSYICPFDVACTAIGKKIAVQKGR